MSAARVPPPAEIQLSLGDLATACGLSTPRVRLLVQLGLVEPEPGTRDRFSSATAARLRRMLRLRDDLGVNLAGAVIIVDLMERLERLDAELRRLSGHSPQRSGTSTATSNFE
jgi:DNA-binding transcriptional MerR regulator